MARLGIKTQLVRSTAQAGTFPLSVSSNGRYLQGANGTPFFLQGVAIWSLEVQVNNTEIDQILDAVQAKGFTCVLFEAIEHEFSSQSPAYENVDGDAPFSSMTDFGSSLVSDYWARVDYIVDGLKARGMAAMINPAYLGYSGGSQGWASEIGAESDADLQTYGQRLANRYTQGNVIWCMGGDYDGDSTLRAKQWQIVTGIRSVRTTDIITAHTAPNEMASDTWNSGTYPGYNLNNIYGYTEDGYDIPVEADGAYAVSGPIPFFLIESRYEGENSVTAAQLRFQSYTPLLRGACGQIFSNNPLWHLEASGYSMYSYTDTWEEALDSDGMQDQQRLADLFTAYAWHKLVPKTDSSLVSSSHGTGTSRVCPALASDGTFAFIWIPASQSVDVVMSAFSISSVRARLYDPTDGSYTTVSGSPFANTGTQSIASGGERVLVLDAP